MIEHLQKLVDQNWNTYIFEGFSTYKRLISSKNLRLASDSLENKIKDDWNRESKLKEAINKIKYLLPSYDWSIPKVIFEENINQHNHNLIKYLKANISKFIFKQFRLYWGVSPYWRV